MTEREIEAVLQAVPLIPSCNHELGICGTGEGTPDYPALARAVAEQVVGPRVRRLRRALQSIVDLKDEAYATEPVSREVADVVARNAGRIARAALADAGAGKERGDG